MLLDPLADMLSKVRNAEKAMKEKVVKKPVSKLIKEVLRVMKENNYIKDFETIEDNKGGIAVINLFGKINNCNVIKPRHSVERDGFEKYEKRFLPASGFGILILSTPHGVMTNVEAKQKKTGGVLLAYVY